MDFLNLVNLGGKAKNSERIIQRKIKIVFVIDSLSIGGAEKITLDVVGNLDKRKFDVSLVSLFNNSNEINISKEDLNGIEFRRLGLESHNYIYRIVVLTQCLKHYDIIHSCLQTSNLYCSIVNLLLFRKKKFISTVHGVEGVFLTDIFIPPSFKYILLIKYLQNFLFRFYDSFFSVSENSRNQFILNRGIIPAKISTVCFGVDLRRFSEYTQAEISKKKHELGITHKDFVLGYFGRVSIGKGLKELITVYGSLRREFNNIKLLIVGDGELLGELKKMCKELDIKENECIFTGFKQDITRYLSILNLLVLPSYSEGIPLSILEAMYYKVIILSSKVGGVPEVIRDGKNGFLFAEGAFEIMQQKIKFIINNFDNLETIRENAKRKILERFDLGKNVRQFENQIYAVLNK